MRRKVSFNHGAAWPFWIGLIYPYQQLNRWACCQDSAFAVLDQLKCDLQAAIVRLWERSRLCDRCLIPVLGNFPQEEDLMSQNWPVVLLDKFDVKWLVFDRYGVFSLWYRLITQTWDGVSWLASHLWISASDYGYLQGDIQPSSKGARRCKGYRFVLCGNFNA